MCAAPKGNKFALGLTNNGRRPDYATAEELAAKIQEYFDYCQGEFHEEEQPKLDKKGLPTDQKVKVKVWDRYPENLKITGLCLFLGFESRGTFDKQAERDDDFSYIVKRAKMVIEGGYEDRLWSDTPGSSTGAIFALKNMGWADKSEVKTDNNHKHTGNVFVFGEAKGCEPINDADGDKAD